MKTGNSAFQKIFIQSGGSSGTGLSSVLQRGGRPGTDLLSVLWGNILPVKRIFLRYIVCIYVDVYVVGVSCSAATLKSSLRGLILITNARPIAQASYQLTLILKLTQICYLCFITCLIACYLIFCKSCFSGSTDYTLLPPSIFNLIAPPILFALLLANQCLFNKSEWQIFTVYTTGLFHSIFLFLPKILILTQYNYIQKIQLLSKNCS